MINRRILIAAAAGCLALAQPAAAQDKPPIKLGAILPLTGFGATYGTLFQTGLNLGVEDVNAAGGVNGSKIELVIEDDQLQATQSVLLFRKMQGLPIAAMLGPVSGTSWENVAPLANAAHLPTVNYTALKPGISVKPYALRLHPADDTMIPEGLAEFIKKFPAAKRVVIAGDLQEASGAAGVDEFKKAVQKLGLTILEVVGYQTRTTDFSPVVIKIRGLDPDAVLISSLVPTTLPLVKEMEAQGFKKPILVSALVWAGNFIHAVGSAGDNLYTMGYNTNEPVAGADRRNAYTARFLAAASKTNLPPPANVSNTSVGYDSVVLLADILRKAGHDGTTDVKTMRETVTQAMGKLMDWQGLNTLRMRPNGDGHIQTHLLKADPQGKQWLFGLPEAERLSQPAL